MEIFSLITDILMCIFAGAAYTVVGYWLVVLFTDSPAWKTWEQVMLWVFWPIFIVISIIMFIGLVIISVLVSIFIIFAIIYDCIKSLILKIIRLFK